MMVMAVVAKSGSRSCSQVSKTVQANLVPLENDADGALAGTTQAKLGMGGHILREIFDAPVGLAATRRIDLRRFLTGQHQQPRLDLSVVLARRWTLGSVLEAVQAVLGEAMAPDKDRADGQTHILRDRSVSLTAGDTQDDLGPIGVLLGGCAGGYAALQFGAFGGQQTNTSTTRSGTRHVRGSFRCFPLQPARSRINSKPSSTSRMGY